MSETHRSYLLRMWREHPEAPWRITLVAVAQPDEHRHFDSLATCFAFLHEQPAPDQLGIPFFGNRAIVAHLEDAEK